MTGPENGITVTHEGDYVRVEIKNERSIVITPAPDGQLFVKYVDKRGRAHLIEPGHTTAV